jgi:hypothetical protein
LPGERVKTLACPGFYSVYIIMMNCISAYSGISAKSQELLAIQLEALAFGYVI